MREYLGLVAACALLAGCGGAQNRPQTARSGIPSGDWRKVATQADRVRLRGWRGAWVTALAQVNRADIAGERELFDPDRSLADAMPPAGAYRCRTFKLGRQGRSGPVFSAYGWFSCRIDAEGGVARLAKIDGSQRPVGSIFPDTDARSVFLGTMVLGDETHALQYGRDTGRDMAGIIERIGPQRWRMALPSPQFESILDVVELVPAR